MCIAVLLQYKGKIAINSLNVLNKVSENNTPTRIKYTKATLDVYRSTLKCRENSNKPYNTNKQIECNNTVLKSIYAKV